ncbi:MAG: ABC transporter permease [Solirubrobacterales bacterium]
MTAQTIAGDAGLRFFGRVRRLPVATTIAVAALGTILFMAIFGPLLVSQDPNLVDLLNPYAPPSVDHLLGTDEGGRDLFARLIVGARTAVIGPLIVVSIGTLFGLVLAIFAAWFGGLLDVGISRFTDLLLAFPGLLLAIVATSVFGVGLVVAAVALSVAYVPYIARVVRSEALRQRRLPYIEASWLRGVPTRVIWLRDLLPALSGVIYAQIVLSFAYATIDVAAVSYLGLGVQAPTADWGTMVASGQKGILEGHPMEALSAGACLVIMILSLGVVGDHLSDRAERKR